MNAIELSFLSGRGPGPGFGDNLFLYPKFMFMRRLAREREGDDSFWRSD